MMARLQKGLALGLVAASLAGCAYPTRNYPLEGPRLSAPYRWSKVVHPPLEDTLVIVSASGGGTRATALTMATLRAMQDVKLPAGDRLGDEIDMISSVSGGSVAAAYFALRGGDGLDDLEHNFVRKDGIGTMLLKYFNPGGLAAASTNGRERVDTFIDYLDDTLFNDRTIQALLDGKPHPYLVLNAGDMVEGTPFAMTQDNFDLLCSDLSKTKLSTAVAASAAFPVGLSPVTLTNYSPCPVQRPSASWPPPWIENGIATNWSQDEETVARARVAAAYMAGTSAPHPKAYIHLLDGGIADNLGIMEPYRMLATNEISRSFLSHIESGEIRNIVFVVVNARSAAPSSLDASPATPGIIDMLLSTISAGIDRTTMGNKERLRQLLREALLDQAQADMDLAAGHDKEADAAAQRGDTARAARLRDDARLQRANATNLDNAATNTFLASVDFDAIADPGCRLAYHSIPTSWTLDDKQVDAVLKIGPALLAEDPEFKRALGVLGGGMAHPPPSVDEVCKSLPAKL